MVHEYQKNCVRNIKAYFEYTEIIEQKCLAVTYILEDLRDNGAWLRHLFAEEKAIHAVLQWVESGGEDTSSISKISFCYISAPIWLLTYWIGERCHGTLIFIGIKLFVCQDQYLFDLEFCETLQNFSSFRQIFRQSIKCAR